MRNLQDFIKEKSKEDSSVGDLAQDIRRDPVIPKDPEEGRFFESLEKETFGKISEEALQDFKNEYFSISK